MTAIVQVSEAYLLSIVALAAIVGFCVGLIIMWRNKL